MAYCTLDEVKNYLGIKTIDDDVLLAQLINQACAFIDKHTSRTFEATSDTIRYYDGQSVDDRLLLLDGDLAQITSVTVNGTSLTFVDDYFPLPRNKVPYWGLEIKCGDCWIKAFCPCDNDQIVIEGRWAYSLTAPDDIKHACLRLTGFYYRQKDAQIFDTIAEPQAGVITVPVGVPAGLIQSLAPYVRIDLQV